MPTPDRPRDTAPWKTRYGDRRPKRAAKARGVAERCEYSTHYRQPLNLRAGV
jgi:hypothetical protein